MEEKEIKKMARDESKILIFGGTSYIGRHMVNASIKLGHPTYVYTRPNSAKTELLNEFHSKGVTLVKGELDDHEKLVAVLKEVEVVISALAHPQFLDQLKIIDAIEVAGNIKRFLPAEFGCEVDRIINVLPPFKAVLENRRRIRRAVEAAEIPYTFVSANLFCTYFINYLLHPHDQHNKITVYGTGEVKAVLNYEEDVGIYTIKVATDPRACNRVVIYRPETNIISQLELISLWENKTGRVFKKVHVPEEELVALSKSLPDPDNLPVSILHSVFVKGDTVNFDIGENDIEASGMYTGLKFTTVEEILDIFAEPPRPAIAAFK